MQTFNNFGYSSIKKWISAHIQSLQGAIELEHLTDWHRACEIKRIV
jgi:hypothetical protein